MLPGSLARAWARNGWVRSTATTGEISRRVLVEQLRALGVGPGEVLLVHTSFRAVRPVEGGPEGLVAALREAIGPEGTLVMPAWTGDDHTPFDANTTPASADLGIVAETFRRQTGVVRSRHPFAFAAAGPHAAHVTSDPLPLPPHIPESPVGRVYELDGKVLLLGVDHDADTTVHLAELLAGVPYRVRKHITVAQDGVPTRLEYGENDHCCARFQLVGEWLREAGLQREAPVGNAAAFLARSRDIVQVVTKHLESEPLLFLHGPDDRCADCDEARRSVAT